MVIVTCRVCSKRFKVKPWHLRQGWGKCCSRRCRDEAQKKGRFVNCSTCGKKVWKMPKDLEHSKSGKFFCNKSCQTLWRNKVYSGPNHAFWSGGAKLYRKKLLESKKVSLCVLCGKRDIRVLQVHHKDGSRSNNDIGSLVWLCINCHHLVHFCNVQTN